MPTRTSGRIWYLSKNLADGHAFQKVLQALHDVACHRDGVTLSMVAVAWALAQTGVKAVLGARAAEHVKDAGRAERLELTEAELESIDASCQDAPGPSGDVHALERTIPALSHMNQQGGPTRSRRII